LQYGCSYPGSSRGATIKLDTAAVDNFVVDFFQFVLGLELTTNPHIAPGYQSFRVCEKMNPLSRFGFLMTGSVDF